MSDYRDDTKHHPIVLHQQPPEHKPPAPHARHENQPSTVKRNAPLHLLYSYQLDPNTGERRLYATATGMWFGLGLATTMFPFSLLAYSIGKQNPLYAVPAFVLAAVSAFGGLYFTARLIRKLRARPTLDA